jgi:7-carboxy-7-deazaguanine synthase
MVEALLAGGGQRPSQRDTSDLGGILSGMMGYLVNDIYAAIQGEGVQTGVAMVLLRLHGCPVACPWCDTRETWVIDHQRRVPTIQRALGSNANWTVATADALTDYIRATHPGPKWVLVTGGEPTTQDLTPLVRRLHQAGYRVALETSGTGTGHLGAGFDWVCVSPKVNMPGGKRVLPEAVATADEIKHVVGRPEDVVALDRLLSTFKTKDTIQICLQPVSLSPKATALCIETVQQRGWRLSVQVHKYLDQR